MGESYLGRRVDALRKTQNPDGGWSYFPNKKISWLEPTLYAALALHGDPAADRAWELLRTWQQDDGSWRPSAEVEIAHSSTALCVTMAAIRGEFDAPFRNGVDFLLGSVGVEHSFWKRTFARWHWYDPERNLDLEGWPWKPGTSSWVEPTAHALVALKKAAAKATQLASLTQRVKLGEALLLDVRCIDGGWNYGNRTDGRNNLLPSYPETTALALVGLQGRTDIGASLDLALKYIRDGASPMAAAWLNIALRLHGKSVDAPTDTDPSQDILITALEALGAPEGNHRLLATGAHA
ncbi:MAG TPA: prenyltransferase/squalene oxidase repeat-containing protein [Bryobacteraceae bacterium]